MPIFFFDTDINGERLDDNDGVELPDLSAVKSEAHLALCQLTAEAETVQHQAASRLCVRDAKGDIVLTVWLTISFSAAAP